MSIEHNNIAPPLCSSNVYEVDRTLGAPPALRGLGAPLVLRELGASLALWELGMPLALWELGAPLVTPGARCTIV